MKSLLLFIALTTISFVTKAQENDGITITVTVPNVTNNDGSVLFALYTEDTFMKREPDFSSAAVKHLTPANLSAYTVGCSSV